MIDQLKFTALLDEVDRNEHEARENHHRRLQAWFDTLPERHKEDLQTLVLVNEWETWSALSAAAWTWEAPAPDDDDMCSMRAGGAPANGEVAWQK